MQYLLREAPGAQDCGERHADTDVYCAKRGTSLVQVPLVVVVSIIVAGLVAFLIAGFVGYAARVCIQGDPRTTILEAGQRVCWHDPWYHFLYLKEPWPLFIWFSGLMVLIQVAVLRAHLRRLITTLAVTAVSILTVAVVYLLGPQYIEDLLIKNPTGLVYQPWLYALINFGVLGAFLVDSLRRWLRYGATELNPERSQELRHADPNRSMALRRAKIGELFSGDLIAGMLLSAVLAFVFTVPFLQLLYGVAGVGVFNCGSNLITPAIHPIAGATHANPCPVPYIKGVPNSAPQDVLLFFGRNLNLIDTFIAITCFVPGIGVLAVTAFIRGLGPLSRATSPASSLSVAGANARGQDVAGQVGMAVFDALSEALRRYILPYARRALLSLRNILWPLLILIGSFSFALCGRYIAQYLHHYDPTYYCDSALKIDHCQAPNNLTYLALALAFGFTGFFTTVASAALLMMSSRVFANTMQLLSRIGYVLLLTFWLFALALFGLNWFLLDTGLVPTSLAVPPAQGTGLCQAQSWQLMLAPPHAQCAQPFSVSWLTAISFGVLVISVAVLLPRLRAGFPGRVAARAATVPLGQ
jgi:hypothetical protein